jgi:hypothetical protein
MVYALNQKNYTKSINYINYIMQKQIKIGKKIKTKI